MPVITALNFAAYPSSGTATTASTGLAAISLLNHAVDADGTKYLVQNAVGDLSMAIVNSSTAAFPSGDDYWVRFVMFGEQIAVTPASESIVVSIYDFWQELAAARMYASTFAQSLGYAEGSLLFVIESTGGGTAGGMPDYIRIPLNQKFEVILHANRVTGDVEVFVNGQVVHFCKAASMTGYSSASCNPIRAYAPRNSHVRWRWYSFESWSGTDIDLTPPVSCYQDRGTDLLTKAYPHVTAAPASNPTGKGYGWTYSPAANAGPTDYFVSAGVANSQRRLKLVTGACTATGVTAIGTLPFNAYGWATVAWKMVYVPTGTASMAIRNAANTADLFKIQFTGTQVQDGSGTQLVAGDGTAVPSSTTKRFQVLLHLNLDGRATFTIIDATSTPSASTRTAWSGPLTSWTPQALGVPVLVGSAATIEMDGISVWRWLELPGFDSMVTADQAGLTPLFQAPGQNVGINFPYSDGAGAVPFNSCAGGGGIVRRRGLERTAWWFMTGRSGLAKTDWLAGFLRKCSHTYGVRLFNIDGFAVNGLGGGVASTEIVLTQEQIDWAKSHNSRIVLSTCATRGGMTGTSYTLSIAVREAIIEFSRKLRSAYQTNYETDPDVFFADPEGGFYPSNSAFSGGDGLHSHQGVSYIYAGGSLPVAKPNVALTTATIVTAISASTFATNAATAATQSTTAAAQATAGAMQATTAKTNTDSLLASVAANLTAINNLNNLSALANLLGSPVLEIPDNGTTQYQFLFTVRDAEGHLVAPDSTPAIAAVNAAGTSRSANLSAVSLVSTGVYSFTYGTAAGATSESIRITATTAVGGSARRADAIAAIADFDSVTAIAAIKAKTDGMPTATQNGAAAAAAILVTPTQRIATNNLNQVAIEVQTQNANGFWNASNEATGLSYADLVAGTYTTAGSLSMNLASLALKFTGITFIADWYRARTRKSAPDATALEEINLGGGTFDPATDSEEAVGEAAAVAAASAAEAAAAAGRGGGTILGPVIAQLPAGIDLRRRTKITASQFSFLRQPIDVYDAAGAALLDLADRTLRFVIHDENSIGIVQLADDDIERGTGDDVSRLYVNIPTTATQVAGGFLWTLWDVSSPSRPQDIGRGPFIVDTSCLAVA